MSRSRLFLSLGQETKQNKSKQSQMESIFKAQAQEAKKVRSTFSFHSKKEVEKFKIKEESKKNPRIIFEEKHKEVKFQQKNEQGKSRSFFSLYNFNILNIVPSIFRSNPNSQNPPQENVYSFNVFLSKCNELKQYFGSFNQKNDFTPNFKQKLEEIEKGMNFVHQDLSSMQNAGQKSTGVLQEILENVKHLNTQTEMARKENAQQREKIRQEKNEEFERTEHQLETAENSRHAQLEKLEKLVEKLEELIKKQDEAANSRLTLGVAYSSILSLVFAILVFLYQSNDSKQKENEQKLAAAEKARLKAEDLTKKIEQIQLQYSGFNNQKVSIEEGIKKLELNKANLVKMRDPKAKKPDSALEVGITQVDAKIEQAKVQLQYVLSELQKLELFVSSQQAVAEAEKHEVEKLAAAQSEEKPQDSNEPFDGPRPPQPF